MDIEGTVQAAEQKIQSCSQSDVEIVVTKVQLSRLCYFVFVLCENATRELRGFNIFIRTFVTREIFIQRMTCTR